jgi:hypothetical protein
VCLNPADVKHGYVVQKGFLVPLLVLWEFVISELMLFCFCSIPLFVLFLCIGLCSKMCYNLDILFFP